MILHRASESCGCDFSNYSDCKSACEDYRHYLFFSSAHRGRNKIQLRIALRGGETDGKKQISWQSADYSLNFNANDDDFNFDNTDNLSGANDNNSGGLVLFRLRLKKES